MMMQRITVIVAGVLLDWCFGDPYWLYHPVRAIGWLITRLERMLRSVFPKNERGERLAGSILVCLVCLITTGAAVFLLMAAGRIHPAVRWCLETFMCYQILAARSLKTESMKVYAALKQGDVEGARKAVSMIVGRDTESLDAAGITKAAVETVAENTSDGVVAPLCFLALGGAVGGFFYKAVNTMDSVVGYKNDRYQHFGRTAAKLDDVVNYIPARLSAVFMVLSAYLTGMDGKSAWKIFLRDRYQHKSPNSAQTEAACAGALGVQLAGNAWYFGVLHEKPTIGDDLRQIDAEDIRRANWLLYGTEILTLILLILILWIL